MIQVSKVSRFHIIAVALAFSGAATQTSAATLTTVASLTAEVGFNASGVTMDAAGNFYGVTPTGGTGNQGSIFKVTSDGAVSVVTHFTPSTGAATDGGLYRDSTGNLFATVAPAFNSGNGGVLKLTPSGNVSVVRLTGSSGVSPNGPLIPDESGNLYGTTQTGGTFGKGTIFKLSTTGALTTLASFNGSNGQTPRSFLTRDTFGNFYGTTEFGGAGTNSGGTIFKLAPDGTLTPLTSFTGTDGPRTSVVLDSAGTIYGSRPFYNTGFGGSIFKLTTDGTYTTLANPIAVNNPNHLIRDAAGNLFGITSSDGAGLGSIFKLTPGGTYINLYSFQPPNTGYINGNYPSSLSVDSAGNLYGSTLEGGAYGQGTVFRLSGSGFVVPEPTSVLFLVPAAYGITRRRRAAISRRAAQEGAGLITFKQTPPRSSCFSMMGRLLVM